MHVGMRKDLSFVLCPYLGNGDFRTHQKVFQVTKYVEISRNKGTVRSKVLHGSVITQSLFV